MFYENNALIADADHTEDLVELLIPGYKEVPVELRWLARLKFATQLKFHVQINILGNITEELYDSLEDWEMKVLEYSEHREPEGGDDDLPEELQITALTPYGWGSGEGELRGLRYDEKVDPELLTAVDVWDSEVPIVLIREFYTQETQLPPPLTPHGDYQYVPNIIWLETDSEQSLLQSLSRIGYITFGEPSVVLL